MEKSKNEDVKFLTGLTKRIIDETERIWIPDEAFDGIFDTDYFDLSVSSDHDDLDAREGVVSVPWSSLPKFVRVMGRFTWKNSTAKNVGITNYVYSDLRDRTDLQKSDDAIRKKEMWLSLMKEWGKKWSDKYWWLNEGDVQKTSGLSLRRILFYDLLINETSEVVDDNTMTLKDLMENIEKIMKKAEKNVKNFKHFFLSQDDDPGNIMKIIESKNLDEFVKTLTKNINLARNTKHGLRFPHHHHQDKSSYEMDESSNEMVENPIVVGNDHSNAGLTEEDIKKKYEDAYNNNRVKDERWFVEVMDEPCSELSEAIDELNSILISAHDEVNYFMIHLKEALMIMNNSTSCWEKKEDVLEESQILAFYDFMHAKTTQVTGWWHVFLRCRLKLLSTFGRISSIMNGDSEYPSDDEKIHKISGTTFGRHLSESLMIMKASKNYKIATENDDPNDSDRKLFLVSEKLDILIASIGDCEKSFRKIYSSLSTLPYNLSGTDIDDLEKSEAAPINLIVPRMKDFFTTEVLRHHVKCLEAKKQSLHGRYQRTKQIFKEIEGIGDSWDKKGYALSLEEIKAADNGIIMTTQMIFNEIRSSELEIGKYLKNYAYVYEDFSKLNDEPNYFIDYGGKFVMPHKSVESECARFIDEWRHIFMARNFGERVFLSMKKDSDAMISNDEKKTKGIKSLVEEGYSYIDPKNDRPVWIDESDGNTLRDIMWSGFYIEKDGTLRRINTGDFDYNEKVLKEWKSGSRSEPPDFIDLPKYSNQVFSFYIECQRIDNGEKFGRILGIDSMMDLQQAKGTSHGEKEKSPFYPWGIASPCKFTFNRTVGEVILNRMKVRRKDVYDVFTKEKAEEAWIEFCKNGGFHSRKQAMDSNKSSSSEVSTNKKKTVLVRNQVDGSDDSEDDTPLSKVVKRKGDSKVEEGKKQRTGLSQKIFFVDLSCEESSSSSDSDDLYVLKPIRKPPPNHHLRGKFMGIYFINSP
jgi:hypothetical protein